MSVDGEESEFEYVGFWARVWASVIDSVLVLMIIEPLASWLSPRTFSFWSGDDWNVESLLVSRNAGAADWLISYVLPAVAVIAFWLTKQATPGKMAIGAKVVDARTGGPLTPGQSIGRYLGYFVSMFPCFLGLLWVAFDSRKQGWHDKLAGTVVIRPRKRGTEPVRFDRS